MLSLILCFFFGFASVNAIRLSPPLTIYSYGYQFSTYNWTAEFAQYANLTYDSINVVTLKTLSVGSSLEFAPPNVAKCDAAFGFDNTYQADIPLNTFQTYVSPTNAQFPPWILARSAFSGVYPYDYAAALLNANTTKLGPSSVATLNSLTLDTFANNPALLRRTAIIRPSVDQIGRAWFLMSVAHFGDPSRSIVGNLDSPIKSWQQFWKLIFPYVNITDSWQTAFDKFSTDPNIALYTTYSTSPLYNLCNMNNMEVINVKLDGYKWYVIEFAGIHRNSSVNLPFAQKFMDWFTSTTLGNHSALDNVMLPANSMVQLPACYNSPLNLNLSTMPAINDYISLNQLRIHLPGMLAEWETLYANFLKNPSGSCRLSLDNILLSFVTFVIFFFWNW